MDFDPAIYYAQNDLDKLLSSPSRKQGRQSDPREQAASSDVGKLLAQCSPEHRALLNPPDPEKNAINAEHKNDSSIRLEKTGTSKEFDSRKAEHAQQSGKNPSEASHPPADYVRPIAYSLRGAVRPSLLGRTSFSTRGDPFTNPWTRTPSSKSSPRSFPNSSSSIVQETVIHIQNRDGKTFRSPSLETLKKVERKEYVLTPGEELRPGGESSTEVPKQVYYRGTGAMPSFLADASCSELGIDGVVQHLRDLLGEAPDIDFVARLLESSIIQTNDFGTLYSSLRAKTSGWAGHQESDSRVRKSLWKLFKDRVEVKSHLHPRRLWDLYSNRVVPFIAVAAAYGSDHIPGLFAVSHSWVPEGQRHAVLTKVNHGEWPVPIPKDITLERVRIELLNSGAEYAWLDVLCLRQEGAVEKESIRQDEWSTDVPTIGWIYITAPKAACYFNGLGRPFMFNEKMVFSRHHWLKRAWTLQEFRQDMIPLGMAEPSYGSDPHSTYEAFRRQHLETLPSIPPSSIFTILSVMRTRFSTMPTDQVAGLFYVLGAHTVVRYHAYDDAERTWSSLLLTMDGRYRRELLFLYPAPGAGRSTWCPTWKQVLTGDLPLPGPQSSCLEHAEHDHLLEPVSGSSLIPQVYYVVEECFVEGLAELPKEGDELRIGAMIFSRKDSDGERQAGDIQARANHREPIPEDLYAVIGCSGPDSDHWIIGRKVDEEGRVEGENTVLRVRKVSVVSVEDAEGRTRLKKLNLGKRRRVAFW